MGMLCVCVFLISGRSATQLIKVMGVSQSLYFTCLALSHQKMTLARERREGISTPNNISTVFFSLPKQTSHWWKLSFAKQRHFPYHYQPFYLSVIFVMPK